MRRLTCAGQSLERGELHLRLVAAASRNESANMPRAHQQPGDRWFTIANELQHVIEGTNGRVPLAAPVVHVTEAAAGLGAHEQQRRIVGACQPFPRHPQRLVMSLEIRERDRSEYLEQQSETALAQRRCERDSFLELRVRTRGVPERQLR